MPGGGVTRGDVELSKLNRHWMFYFVQCQELFHEWELCRLNCHSEGILNKLNRTVVNKIKFTWLAAPVSSGAELAVDGLLKVKTVKPKRRQNLIS